MSGITTTPQRSTTPMDEQEDREVERLADDTLDRWRRGETLSTLDLRAACHAAERAGDASAEREIAGQIADREAQGQTR